MSSPSRSNIHSSEASTVTLKNKKGRSRDGRREISHNHKAKNSYGDELISNSNSPMKSPNRHPGNSVYVNRHTGHQGHNIHGKNRSNLNKSKVYSGSEVDDEESHSPYDHGRKAVGRSIPHTNKSKGQPSTATKLTYPALDKPGTITRGTRSNATTATEPHTRNRLLNKPVFRFRYIFNWFRISGPIELTNKYARQIVEQYDLQPWHLKKMKRKFDEIDIDRSGTVTIEEFLEATGSSWTPFTDKLFTIIDVDGHGSIDFDEYVAVLTSYCTLSKNDILKFCFDCFDTDQSGAIDEKEFIHLCKSVHGDAGASFPSNFKKALEDFDVNEDGLIDFHEFVAIERRFPMILFPAFQLQDTMQRHSLGERGWLKVLEAYCAKKLAEEYHRIHGQPPREPIVVALAKRFYSWINPPVVKQTTHLE